MDSFIRLLVLTSVLIPIQSIPNVAESYGSSPLKVLTHIPVEIKSKHSKTKKTQPKLTSSTLGSFSSFHMALCTYHASPAISTKKVKLFFFFNNFIFIYVCVCVRARVMAEAEKKGIRSGTRVRGGCKQPSIGSGNQILVLWKNSKHS